MGQRRVIQGLVRRLTLGMVMVAFAACDQDQAPPLADPVVSNETDGGFWAQAVPPGDFEAVCNPDGVDIAAIELEMWELMNADRVQHAEEANGAAPLVYDTRLAAAARWHSYTMCIRGELAHVIDGEDFADRFLRHVGLEIGKDYFYGAENIAWNYSVVGAEEAFVEGEPPCDRELGGHRLNILNRNLTHTGVGYCDCRDDAYGNFYITQNFATFDASKLF